jgi:5-formyltetrahydrofolate cyclo-ligase
MSIEKTELRKLMRARKRALDETQKQREADAVFAAVEALDVFRNAQHILLYYSLPDELPTHRIVQRWAQSKTVYLPRVKGDDLEIVPYDDSLSDDNTFHIGEPQGKAVDPACLQMIVVPGVAFDLHGNRMGRGKGFYDRLLAAHPGGRLVGLAFDCQILPDLPHSPWDIPMDWVVTPTRSMPR